MPAHAVSTAAACCGSGSDDTAAPRYPGADHGGSKASASEETFASSPLALTLTTRREVELELEEEEEDDSARRRVWTMTTLLSLITLAHVVEAPPRTGVVDGTALVTPDLLLPPRTGRRRREEEE